MVVVDGPFRTPLTSAAALKAFGELIRIHAMKHVWPIVAALSIGLQLGGNQASRGEQVSIDLTQWTPPDIGTVSDDPFGQLVRYGHNLFTDTATEIGPSVSEPAKRLAGNNLACQNCHLRGGTQPYAMPMTGIKANRHSIRSLCGRQRFPAHQAVAAAEPNPRGRSAIAYAQPYGD